MRIREEIEYRSTMDLKPDPENELYHSSMNEMEYTTLLASVEELGIQEPLWITSDNMIVSGHQRWKVAQKLHLKEVPVKVVEGATQEEIRYLNVTANEARRGEEKDPIKKAKHLRVMYEHWGVKRGGSRREVEGNGQNVRLNAEDIAKMFGETSRNARRLLKLLDLIPKLQEMVSNGIIGITAGNELASLSFEEQQQIALCIKEKNIKEVKTIEIQAIKRELEYLRRNGETLEPLHLRNEQKADYAEIQDEPMGRKLEPGAPDDVLEERPWKSKLEKRNRAIDAVSTMFHQDNAINVRRRVMLTKIEKAVKQIESVEKNLLPFFDDMIDYPDIVVCDSMRGLIRKIEQLTSKLENVVNWK